MRLFGIASHLGSSQKVNKKYTKIELTQIIDTIVAALVKMM